MIKITPSATQQIATARQQSDCADLALRIAIDVKQDGSFNYLMGFDDQSKTGDITVDAEGANLVVDGGTQPLAEGMTLDFVELDGKMEFIFINPNDPKQKKPLG